MTVDFSGFGPLSECDQSRGVEVRLALRERRLSLVRRFSESCSLILSTERWPPQQLKIATP